MHSSGLKRSQTLPAAYHRSSTVRGFRRFMWALNFENASLIGLKSGEYGGRNKSQAPRLSTARLASSHLLCRQIVKHDDDAFLKGRGELRFDVPLKRIAIHCALD